ncbi:threonine--tRNA ligase, partial [Candidatus Dojkabacteria bacterium]|nr:threonine--tRNA ligase [Candidatus Dojkabacteria bacterium]
MENKNDEQLFKMRHSAEHILTQAMKELGYNFYMAIGPAIDDGFYFDFELLEGELTEAEFKKIENKINSIINQDLPITKQVVDEKKARELFKDNPYKQELIDELVENGDELSVYWTGEPNNEESFVDLCKGPHVESTKQVGVVKLLSIAGAYWRGDEKNKMLTRIYGTAFATKEEMKAYLEMLEEAEKRNHRKIGKELNLFVFSEIVGKGLPLWTERGSIIRRELEHFVVEEEIKRGYIHVYTPDIARVALYEKSGHYPYYKDSMYNPIEDEEEQFMLRPMTCPHHFELYLSKPRSYKELPMRIAELAKLYRYEKSGELTGLQRVRSFCLADAHIVCADKEQAKSEIEGALDLIEYAAGVFGLKQGDNYRYRLSLGDKSDSKKYYKDDKSWEDAENVLREVLKERNADYFEAEGEAAFYGPKIDFQMKNVYGKEDTAFTVQYDFVMP